MANEIPPYDIQGALIYIIGVLIWYAIGYGLILIDTINPRSHPVQSYGNRNVYQAVNDLHEHKARNELLMELKDKDRRKKFWQIYYGSKVNPSLTRAKEKETVDAIGKQLQELNEQQRTLENVLDEIHLDQTESDKTEGNRDRISPNH